MPVYQPSLLDILLGSNCRWCIFFAFWAVLWALYPHRMCGSQKIFYKIYIPICMPKPLIIAYLVA